MIHKLLLGLTVIAVIIQARPQQPSTYIEDDAVMHPRHVRPITKTVISQEEFESDYWINQARATLKAKRDTEMNKNIAKNVIMFLGDGLSIGTIKAARVWLGQQKGEDGEATKLAMEEFPYTGLSKTYCLDAQTADSACSATAYLAGVKTNDGAIGVNGKSVDCNTNLDKSNHVFSIAKWSQDVGKKTGIVTTTRVSHASPAGVYAHVPYRDWEYNTGNNDCTDITLQLIHGETGKNINVILGGGRATFLPNTTIDIEGSKGSRYDGQDLIHEWIKSKGDAKAAYIWNRAQLLSTDINNDYLLGLFESGHMQYYLDAVDKPAEPTLPEMTEVAIKMLSKSENGYFLFVEGGRIDMAHHGNLAQKALAETVQFSEAINIAKKLTSEEDTLIVVTSDHSHVFSQGGYPKRGNDILGIAGYGDDKVPYTTLAYANGPGYKQEENGKRHDFSQYDFSNKDLLYPALAHLDSETHSGEDVAIFARGPWAHLFSGVMEQNVIPHLMAYASCVGDGAIACRDSSNSVLSSKLFILFCLSIAYFRRYI